MIKPPVGVIGRGWNPAADVNQSIVNPTQLDSSWVIHRVSRCTPGPSTLDLSYPFLFRLTRLTSESVENAFICWFYYY